MMMDKHTLLSEKHRETERKKERKNEKKRGKKGREHNSSGNKNYYLYLNMLWKKRKEKKNRGDSYQTKHRASQRAKKYRATSSFYSYAYVCTAGERIGLVERESKKRSDNALLLPLQYA